MNDVTREAPLSVEEEEARFDAESGFEAGPPTEDDLKAYLRGELSTTRPQ